MGKTAVFDLDGTLVDTAPDLAESLNHCLAAADIGPLALETIRPYAGHGARPMLAKAYDIAGRDLTASEMDIQVARFLSHYRDHIAVHSAPFPGVVDAMDRLEGAGWRLAVCTNKLEALAGDLLRTLKLADRFLAICGADTFTHRKPDPLHLTETVARAGGAIDKTLMIGDTLTDIDTARAANVASILVDFGYAPDADARAGATLVIDDYAALDAALAERLIDKCDPGF